MRTHAAIVPMECRSNPVLGPRTLPGGVGTNRQNALPDPDPRLFPQWEKT